MGLAEAARERRRERIDMVTGVLSVVVAAGVYIDGWAHVNLGGIETFFTPWHAALHGGFAVLSLCCQTGSAHPDGAGGTAAAPSSVT